MTAFFVDLIYVKKMAVLLKNMFYNIYFEN